MIYKQYLLKSQRTILTAYECSGCNKLVVSPVKLTSESAYNDKGALTERGVEKRHDRAMQSMSSKMEDINRRLIAGDDVSVFRKAKLRCKCPHCGYIEPWARMHYSFFENLFYLGIIVGAFAIYSEHTALGWIAVVIGIVSLSYKWTHIYLMEKEIRKRLLNRALFFSDNLEELKKKVSANIGSKNII